MARALRPAPRPGSAPRGRASPNSPLPPPLPASLTAPRAEGRGPRAQGLSSPNSRRARLCRLRPRRRGSSVSLGDLVLLPLPAALDARAEQGPGPPAPPPAPPPPPLAQGPRPRPDHICARPPPRPQGRPGLKRGGPARHSGPERPRGSSPGGKEPYGCAASGAPPRLAGGTDP